MNVYVVSTCIFMYMYMYVQIKAYQQLSLSHVILVEMVCLRTHHWSPNSLPNPSRLSQFPVQPLQCQPCTVCIKLCMSNECYCIYMSTVQYMYMYIAFYNVHVHVFSIQLFVFGFCTQIFPRKHYFAQYVVIFHLHSVSRLCAFMSSYTY